MKYRKKPVVIEAFRLGHDEMPEWFDKAKHKRYFNKATKLPAYEILTLEGNMMAIQGDYIIKGVRGELYPCKTDIFEETYEAME